MSSSSSDGLDERIDELVDEIVEDYYNDIVEDQPDDEANRAYIERDREGGDEQHMGKTGIKKTIGAGSKVTRRAL